MMTRSDLRLTVLCACLLAVATACRSETRNAADTTQQAMAGMHEDTLAARVQAHLQRLATNNPDSLRALVPADREVVTTLIADCEKMMRDMKMTPPQKWQDAVRDLRQDLDRMATMSGAQLQSAVPEHRKRIEDMLSMRRDMMNM